MLGLSDYVSDRTVTAFREHDERRLHEHYTLHDDEEKMAELAKTWKKELEEMFERDIVEEVAG